MGEAHHEPLLAGLVAGRDEEFAELYAREGAALYRVALTLLRSRADAEDAVQEVFVGIAQSRSTLGAVNNLRSYLFTALRHAAAKIATRRRPTIGKPLVEDVAASEPTVETAGHSGRLERALAALPPDRREIIALKIDAGLTFREIAGVLGINPNTAASRYRHALAELRETLGDDTGG